MQGVPVVRILGGDRGGDAEVDHERAATPPFGRLAAVILSGEEGEKVREVGRQLAKVAPSARGVKVWGPTPAFYHLLRGQTRERLLVQADKTVDVQAYLRAWLALVKAPNAVRVTVEQASVLQGFRADYPWQGARYRQFRQIGNAVCPPLAAKVLAEAMRPSR